MIIKQKKLPCKVISIGNITSGGTGKTPMTIYIAKLLQEFGKKVVVISRGYKGALESKGGIVSDGINIISVKKAGDEPYLIAKKLKNIPVLVCKDRYKIGMLAIKKFNPDIIILDDAFQNIKIDRDINLVLLDDHKPFGNFNLIPRGNLREPINSLYRADALILTRCDLNTSNKKVLKNHISFNKPIFESVHVPYIYKIISSSNSSLIDTKNIFLIKQKKIFAFSGICNNNNFLQTLYNFDCDIKDYLLFSDHHKYLNKDIQNIFRIAKSLDVEYIITTEKDFVKIDDSIKWPIDLVVIGINISFKDDEDKFKKFLLNNKNL